MTAILGRLSCLYYCPEIEDAPCGASSIPIMEEELAGSAGFGLIVSEEPIRRGVGEDVLLAQLLHVLLGHEPDSFRHVGHVADLEFSVACEAVSGDRPYGSAPVAVEHGEGVELVEPESGDVTRWSPPRTLVGELLIAG